MNHKTCFDCGGPCHMKECHDMINRAEAEKREKALRQNCDNYAAATNEYLQKLLKAKAESELLAKMLLNSDYTYDGHLKGRDVVFCEYCNAEPMDILTGKLIHESECPVKLAKDILTPQGGGGGE